MNVPDAKTAKRDWLANLLSVNTALTPIAFGASRPKEFADDAVEFLEDGLVESKGGEEVCRDSTKYVMHESKAVAVARWTSWKHAKWRACGRACR